MIEIVQVPASKKMGRGRWWLWLAPVVLVPVLALVIWPHGVFEPRADRLARQLLTAKEAKARGAAAKELGQMGPAAQRAAPALVEALGDRGRYLTATLIIIPQENYVASDAFVALKSVRGPETVEALANALADMPAKKRAWERGENDPDRRSNFEVEGMIVELLADYGAAALPAAEGLLDAMEGNGNTGVTTPGLKALIAMQLPLDSPAAEKARRVLPQLCNSEVSGRVAATELRRLSPNDDKVYEIYVRSMLIGNVSPPPGALVLDEKTVSLVISNLNAWMYEGAIRELSQGEPAAVLGPLREALKNKRDFRVRSGAALALAARGPDFAAAEPDLIPLLTDNDVYARYAAATAIWSCAHKVDVALPVILAERDNEKSDARQQAQKFLASRSKADAWAAPALVELAGSGHEKKLRLEALALLTQIGPAAVEQSPRLLALLKDDDADIQRAAAKALAAVEKK